MPQSTPCAPVACLAREIAVLDVRIEGFRKRLTELGYSAKTIRDKLWIVRAFIRWLEGEQIAVDVLDEGWAARYVAARQHRGKRKFGVQRTICQFVELLRLDGVVPAAAPIDDDVSPTSALLASYVTYLRRERGLARTTVSSYVRFAGAFVHERCGDDVTVDAADVRDFLLERVPRMSPRYGQTLAMSLRSFLRFTFLRGLTGLDLSSAIPSVRRRRFTDVTRFISAQEVEQVVSFCDLSSPAGRRDHAILLLLARLGLRAGEVLAMELDDIRWREGEIVVRGKGAVRDRLPLLPDVGTALARYVAQDRPRECGRRVFLCAAAPHRPFSNVSTISGLVARAFARAGLDPPCRGAHTLRHSLATTMVRRGASLEDIGLVLRHRVAATTGIYAKLDLDALRGIALPWPGQGGGR